MPRLLPRSARPCALILLISFLFAACSSPTPTPAPPPPTVLAVLADPTATLAPTETPTETPTATATTTETPTETPTPSVTPSETPRGRAPSSGIPWTRVWFPGDLVAELGKLTGLAPEAPLARPENVNPLTGLEVADPALLHRRPVLARIGNDLQARPHAGLAQADLVFEEMIDQNNMFFYVTRLTAVFLGQNATIRPLRSARMVNASLQPMLQGILVHSGASDGTRWTLERMPWGSPKTKSLNFDDQWYGRAECSIGNSYLNRMATTVERVQAVAASQKLAEDVPLRGFDFGEVPGGGAPVASLALDHKPWPIGNSREFTVQWKYDADSGYFLRFSGGQPYNTQQYALKAGWGGACEPTGPVTTEQVRAANVVVLNAAYEPTSIVENKVPLAYGVFVQLTGSGPARIYRDGVQLVGTWRRPTLEYFFQFFDSAGNVIPLKPGNTWFEIAPPGYAPTLK